MPLYFKEILMIFRPWSSCPHVPFRSPKKPLCAVFILWKCTATTAIKCADKLEIKMWSSSSSNSLAMEFLPDDILQHIYWAGCPFQIFIEACKLRINFCVLGIEVINFLFMFPNNNTFCYSLCEMCVCTHLLYFGLDYTWKLFAQRYYSTRARWLCRFKLERMRAYTDVRHSYCPSHTHGQQINYYFNGYVAWSTVRCRKWRSLGVRCTHGTFTRCAAYGTWYSVWKLEVFQDHLIGFKRIRHSIVPSSLLMWKWGTPLSAFVPCNFIQNPPHYTCDWTSVCEWNECIVTVSARRESAVTVWAPRDCFDLHFNCCCNNNNNVCQLECSDSSRGSSAMHKCLFTCEGSEGTCILLRYGPHLYGGGSMDGRVCVWQWQGALLAVVCADETSAGIRALTIWNGRLCAGLQSGKVTIFRDTLVGQALTTTVIPATTTVAVILLPKRGCVALILTASTSLLLFVPMRTLMHAC